MHFSCDSRSHYWRQNWFGNFYDPQSLWRCSVASVVQSCASAALFGRVSTETPLALTTCGFQPLNSLFNGRFFPQLITTPIIIHFKFVNFFGIYNPHKILKIIHIFAKYTLFLCLLTHIRLSGFQDKLQNITLNVIGH